MKHTGNIEHLPKRDEKQLAMLQALEDLSLFHLFPLSFATCKATNEQKA